MKKKMKMRVINKITLKLDIFELTKLMILVQNQIEVIDKLLIACEKEEIFDEKYHNTLVDISESYKKLYEKLRY